MRKESPETSFYFYKLKCSCLVNKVVHFISRLSTCFQHSVFSIIILNYLCDWAMIVTQSFAWFHLAKAKSDTIAGGMSSKERQLFITHQHLFSKTSRSQMN